MMSFSRLFSSGLKTSQLLTTNQITNWTKTKAITQQQPQQQKSISMTKQTFAEKTAADAPKYQPPKQKQQFVTPKVTKRQYEQKLQKEQAIENEMQRITDPIVAHAQDQAFKRQRYQNLLKKQQRREEARKAKEPVQKLREDVKKVWLAQQQRQDKEIELKLASKAEFEKQVKKEFLDALSEEVDMWKYHPDELQYHRYVLKDSVNFEGTKMLHKMRTFERPLKSSK